MVVVLEQYGREIPSLELLQERFGLTRRQGEVALLLCERRRNSEIAKLLSISPNTARHHTESVLLKLGVRSRDAVESVIVRTGGASGAGPAVTR
jgi:DNA-binding CsgD family transcriptional regulator